MPLSAIALARSLSRALRESGFLVKHNPTDTRFAVGDEKAQATVFVQAMGDDEVKLFRAGLHSTGRKPLGFPTRINSSVALRESLVPFLEKSGLIVDVVRWPNE